jgi:putative phosphoesterase
VSDTHDNLPLARRAAAFLRARSPDLVLHLGDICTPAIVDLFADLPVRFLRGNNDVDERLPDALAAAGLPPLLDEWTGDVGGVRLAATHGHRAHLVHRHLGQADLLLHGHTHQRRAEKLGNTLVVNPGALHRCAHKTIALVHLPEARVEYLEVTGEGVRAFHG